MPNKGKHLKFCKYCVRNRYCDIRVGARHKWITCSKGHTWQVEKSTFEIINEIEKRVVTSHIEKLFHQDDTFFKKLKGH